MSTMTMTAGSERLSATPVQDAGWAPVADFTVAGLAAEAGDAFELWGVARTTGTGWTLLSATDGMASTVGVEYRYEETLCSALLKGDESVLVADLRRRKDPFLRSTSERFDVRAYVGAPLVAPDGTSVGSLCGWSRTPSHDDERLRSRVTRNAGFLGAALARELRATREQRQEDWATTPSSRDALTRMADRRAWGQLLQREEVRGRALAEPAAVTIVDAGAVSSTRGLRRLSQAMAEAAGTGSAVARTGQRTFGLLSCATGGETASAVADRFVSDLAGIAPQARTGRAVRRGTAPLAEVWAAAEADLLVARRGSR